MEQAIIVGSPNSGKSLLFNRLTGMNQRVANFPGITVDVHKGDAKGTSKKLSLLDIPGTYSLKPVSQDEKVAVQKFQNSLADEDLKFVLCLIDATRLERGLYFALQVILEAKKHGKTVVVAANMMDTLNYHKLSLDIEGLSKALGVDVVGISAKTNQGMSELVSKMDGDFTANFNPKLDEGVDLKQMAKELTTSFGPKGDLLIRSQNTFDKFLLHSVFGGICFFAIMYVMFQSVFTWAGPAMDAIEESIGWVAGIVTPLFSSQMIQDFLKDAIFGGVGAFLVFIPPIFILTFLVGLLEDSGYLARAAVICHRPLKFFGLTGKSFVPMLTGVACAIPGIYAARSIESCWRRWLTYFALPLMPCSARLPVYTLLIAAVIPSYTVFGGLVGLQGLAMFLIYLFGIMVGLVVTAVLSRAKETPKDDLPFVLEMPPYRMPSLMPLLIKSAQRSKQFITKAGWIIFNVTVIIWVLGYFPNHGADLGESFLGQIGKVIEPVFAPLGLDWKYGVAIIMSFLAREVFVGTLGALFGIEGADENIVGLADHVQSTGLTFGSGLALIVFFAVAMQCVSTLAVLKKETGSWKMPVQIFVAYSVLAYVLAYITVLIF